TVTRSETEALLLEQNLIKSLKPPYNILLRDDKSYPYIFISDKDEYPALRFHRGARKRSGRYFGPFPSGTAVRDSLNLMQKLFKVRQCEDSFYRNRTRPCLQYQINRCTAPCVKAISRSDYADDIRHTMLFLEGKSQAVLRELGDQMEQASAQLNFEQAAILRDQIISMQKVQEQQGVEGSAGEADIIGCAMKSGAACVHMLFVRGGRIIGSKVFHPKPSLEESTNELTSAFIAQWYLSADREIPPQVIVHAMPHDQGILSDALQQKRGRQTAVVSSVRGDRASWLKLAQSNAEQQLDTALANKKHVYARYLDLQQILELEKVPQRMECFDISHSSGEATVASCVVFDRNGPLKSDYRRFNITGITEGDDYAAMHQALTRRYQRIKKEDAKLPDVLVIDGGKGQITQAMDVLSSLALDSVTVIGIAKGPTRKAGFEVLINGLTGEEIVPKSDSAGLHLLQHIRDESHRFAITGHRAKRGKARKKSVLEDIEGIGPKRRRELLKH
ncbi:MAG: excinuclease ABC subunit UvrC, partial [Pontibacterium sp.]